MQSRQNILLVDDRQENLVALEAILGELGQNLVKARSGKEALRLILKQEFALILLDAQMPDMDGFETAQLVRTREKSRHIPIIFLTAINKTDSHILRGYSVGAVDYIFKPFAPEVLKAKVHAMITLFRKSEEVKAQAALLRNANRELDETSRKILQLNKELEAKNMELQIDRDFVATVLQTAGSPVIILDRLGRIVSFNRACQRITGYSSDDVKDRTVWDIFLPPTEAEAARTAFARVLDSNTAVESESSWRVRDGSSRFILWCQTPLIGAGGVTDFVVATGMDLTERRKAEESREQLIREQAARIQAEAAQRRSAFLAEAGAALVSSLDYKPMLESVTRLVVPALADGCIIYMPSGEDGLVAAVASHADASKQELIEDLYGSALPLNDDSHPAVKAFRTGQPQLWENPSAREHDEVRETAAQREPLRQVLLAIPLVTRGRAKGVMQLLTSNSVDGFGAAELSLAQELADRLALAVENAQLYHAAQEANTAKDHFLATVSHELRTPLNAMLGWTRLLRSGKLDPAAASRALETIERNARAQTQIIDDILDISRIIMGKLRLNFEPVDLAAIIEAAVDTARPTAELKGLQLERALDTSEGMVFGDPERIQQIAWNLLSNAVKFTPSGGRITVQLESEGSTVKLCVRDTGQGIPSDFLPHVFDHFTQAEGSSSRSYGGLGLGLAIVRHLVELHSGTVTAASDGPGRGSTFTVTLPARTAEAESKAPSVDWRRENIKQLDGVHVLLLDSEAGVRDPVTRVLRRCGAAVLAVESVAQAVESMQLSPSEVCILNAVTRSDEAAAALAQIRESNAPACSNVPAIALSTNEDMQKLLQAGFQACLRTPADPEELSAAVAHLTGRAWKPASAALQQSEANGVDV